jgi:hypothetical protein
MSARFMINKGIGAAKSVPGYILWGLFMQPAAVTAKLDVDVSDARVTTAAKSDAAVTGAVVSEATR